MTQTTRVIPLRPPSRTTAPACSVVQGGDPALYPAFHDLGLWQQIRRHRPTTGSPRHLPASTAVPPVPPGAPCRIIPQGQARALTPYAIVLVVATQLRTHCRVLFLERAVAVVSAPTPTLPQGAAAPRPLRLPFAGISPSPGLAPVVPNTQKAEGPGLAPVRRALRAPALDPLGLLRVALPPLLRDAFLPHVFAPPRVLCPLAADEDIVRVAVEASLASAVGFPHRLQPRLPPLVHVCVGHQRRAHLPLAGSPCPGIPSLCRPGCPLAATVRCPPAPGRPCSACAGSLTACRAATCRRQRCCPSRSPAPSCCHAVPSGRHEGLMWAAARAKAIGGVAEVLLVDRLPQHRHRFRHALVLPGREPQRSALALAVGYQAAHARLRTVRVVAALLVSGLPVRCQVRLVRAPRAPVHARGAARVEASACVLQHRHLQMGGERGARHVGRCPGLRGAPFQAQWEGHRARSPWPRRGVPGLSRLGAEMTPGVAFAAPGPLDGVGALASRSRGCLRPRVSRLALSGDGSCAGVGDGGTTIAPMRRYDCLPPLRRSCAFPRVPPSLSSPRFAGWSDPAGRRAFPVGALVPRWTPPGVFPSVLCRAVSTGGGCGAHEFPWYPWVTRIGSTTPVASALSRLSRQGGYGVPARGNCPHFPRPRRRYPGGGYPLRDHDLHTTFAARYRPCCLAPPGF